ncbi:hypothetical protein [Fibrella arboris]|uniref:hypothetical protein n=1 Tax=Fibrella arboris TaxID=3242486 RepID=UPI003521CED1
MTTLYFPIRAFVSTLLLDALIDPAEANSPSPVLPLPDDAQRVQGDAPAPTGSNIVSLPH